MKMALRLGAGTSHAARRPAFRATGRGFAVARAQQKGGAPGLLAPAGVGLGVALFILSRTAGGGLATLSDLAASSVPLDVALSNDRPSVVEFYADWCEVRPSPLPLLDPWRPKTHQTLTLFSNSDLNSLAAGVQVFGQGLRPDQRAVRRACQLRDAQRRQPKVGRGGL